jgi:hypothetical protein
MRNDMSSETVDEMLAGLTLPAGIQATVLEVRTAATATTVTRIAVWGPAQRECPGCGATERDPIRECPVTLDPSVGDTQAWSQQHGCGAWWGSTWAVIDPIEPDYIEPDDADRIRRLADEIMEDVRAAEAEADTQTMAALRTALTEALDELGSGAEPDYVTTGSATEPGVYRDGDEWLAWAYAAAWDNDGTEFLEVRESEVREGAGA